MSRLLIAVNTRGLPGGFGGKPAPRHAQRSLEVKVKRRWRSGGINDLKINNCRLTRVYCQRNGRGQEDHCCQNTSEGNGGEHCWHFHHHHGRSGQEDNGEAPVCSPTPRLCKSRGPPSSPLDQPNGRRRRSATRSPSSPRHELALQPPSNPRHKSPPKASAMAGA